MFYCPELGRFFARDMIRRPGANPYVYCANNPPAFVDPLGLQDIKTFLNDAEKAGIPVGKLREVQDTTLKPTTMDDGIRYNPNLNNLYLTSEVMNQDTKAVKSFASMDPSQIGVLIHELLHAVQDKKLERTIEAFQDVTWTDVLKNARAASKGSGLSDSTVDYITRERLGNYLEQRVKGYVKTIRLAQQMLAKMGPCDGLQLDAINELQKELDAANAYALSQMGYDEKQATDPARLKIDRPGSNEINFLKDYLKLDPQLNLDQVLKSAGFEKQNLTWSKPSK